MEMTLKKLFNYQRFVQNNDLKDVIDSVNLSVSKQALSDDDLYMVAAGVSTESPSDWNEKSDLTPGN